MKHKIYKLPAQIKMKTVIRYPAIGSDPLVEDRVPDEVINKINALIDNLEELEKKLDLILKSRLGKAIMGLARSEDKEEKL